MRADHASSAHSEVGVGHRSTATMTASKTLTGFNAALNADTLLLNDGRSWALSMVEASVVENICREGMAT